MASSVMRVAVVASSLVLAACTTSAGTAPADLPVPSANADELVAFCEAYDEVANEDTGTIYEALLEVAPADLRQPLVRLTSGPSDSQNDDIARVNDFLDRCEG